MPDLKQTIKVDMKGVAKVKANLKELEKRTRKLESAGRASAQTNQKAGASFKSMALAVGGSTVALMALTKVFSSMIKTGKEFEQSMANVKAISGASGAEFKALENNAKKLGATTVHTASAVAGLQTEFAKLGFTAKEITQVTGATLALATATGSDLALSASVAGETLRGFGMEVSETGRVTDVMAKSFSSSALDMQKFSDSMSYVAPVAKMAGFGIEGTTAILGQLANAGISGSMAGTALRKIFLELSNESSKLSKRLGGSVTSIDELVPALQKLNKEGISTAEMKDLVGQRAISAFSILLDGADDVDTLSEALNNAGGSAQEMADIQLDTLEGKTKLLTSAFDGLMITMFEMSESTLKGLTETMTTFVESIDEEDIKAYTTALKLVVGGFALYKTAVFLATLETRKFTLALTSTGLGALIVGLGIATAELLKFFDVFEDGEPEVDETNKSLQTNVNILKEQEKAVQEIYGEHITKSVKALNTELSTNKGWIEKIKQLMIDKTIATKEDILLARDRILALQDENKLLEGAIALKKHTAGGDDGDEDPPTNLPTLEQLLEAQEAIDEFDMTRAELQQEKWTKEQEELKAHLDTLDLSEEEHRKVIERMDVHYNKKKKKNADLKKAIDAEVLTAELKNYAISASAGATFFAQFAGSQKLAGRMKQAQATIDTFATINKIMADPKLIYPTNVIMAIESGVRGFANVMAISNQLGEFKTAQTGMDEIVTQPTTILTGEGGTAERVQVTPLGEDEPTGGGGSPINISFSGNVMSQDFIEDEAIPMIREALRRGEDIGIS